MTKGVKPSFDVNEARALLEALSGDWREVANRLAKGGVIPTQNSIYQALRRAGMATRYRPTNRGRPLGANSVDTGCWQPAPPKPLTVVPCYRTDTVRSAAANPFA